MIRVLYGIQFELIENEINSFINKNNILNVIKYDYLETDIETILNECSYTDLFGENKIVIVYNSSFLTSKETLESAPFEKYILNPNPTVNLFFVVNESSLDARKKIFKLLEKNYEINEFNTFSEYQALKYVKGKFAEDGYDIEEKALKKMIEYLSTNFGLYDNEIKKLKLYKLDEKNILLSDVVKVTSCMPESDVFKLIDAVIYNDKKSIFKIYDDLKKGGIQDVPLLALLSNQFRLLYQVSVLYKDGKNNNEIVSMLKVKPYPVALAIKKIGLFKEEKLLDILYKLSLLDIKIKSTEGDNSVILKEFFLNL